VQRFIRFFTHLVMAKALACTAKPAAQRAKKICAVVYVPIHEANTQNKSLKKLFHIGCYRQKAKLLSTRIAGFSRDGYIGHVPKILASVLSFLYPQRCTSCKTFVQPEEHFCRGCLPFVRAIASPLCLCCGEPFATPVGPDHLCRVCLAAPPPFRRARAWAYYQTGEATPQPLSEAIQHFKYQRNLSVGKALATLAATHFSFSDEDYDVIVPVPLHIDRLRWRGFNQSLLLSRVIGRTRKIKVDPFLLARTRSTAPQTQLPEKERRENVKGAFTVVSPKRIQKQRVLLVDDVYTSGATVRECANALSYEGARIVDVFTLARAVSH